MRDTPEAEARALLAGRLVCPDAPSWTPHRMQPGTFTLECGLVDEQGARAGLHLQLLVHVGQKTALRTYKFTVFRMTLGSPERVYQLHVKQAPRPPANAHDMPHEHVGSLRVVGDASWLRWGYPQALDRFCSVTGISFDPAVPDPEEFRLQP